MLECKDRMAGIKTRDAMIEIKEINDAGEFEGYASTYGNVDEGGDIVVKGAFDEYLGGLKKMPKLLWQHRYSEIVGSIKALSSDSTGLLLKGQLLTELQKGREALVLMKEGVLDSMSIGYRVTDYAMEDREGKRVRLLNKLMLEEVSLVTFPMNKNAVVTDVKQLNSIREVEQILRDAGVPDSFAKLVAGHGFKEAQRRVEARDEPGSGNQPNADFAALLAEMRGLKEALTNE